jgi:hypothetical protein
MSNQALVTWCIYYGVAMNLKYFLLNIMVPILNGEYDEYK